MRRRIRLLAALAAGGVVALCVGVVGVAVAAANPGPPDPSPDTRTVPRDMIWAWVTHCGNLLGVDGTDPESPMLTLLTIDSDGGIDLQYGVIDDKGVQTTDDELTAAANACVQTRPVQPASDAPRPSSDAARLTLYDWAVRRQQPCLASHGIETVVPPLEQFLDDEQVPWYLLDQYTWSGPNGLVDIDIGTLLEVRHACPPMPPFLSDNLGW